MLARTTTSSSRSTSTSFWRLQPLATLFRKSNPLITIGPLMDGRARPQRSTGARWTLLPAVGNLERLARQPGMLVSGPRSKTPFGFGDEIEHAVEVHISRLRKKLDVPLIHNSAGSATGWASTNWPRDCCMVISLVASLPWWARRRGHHRTDCPRPADRPRWGLRETAERLLPLIADTIEDRDPEKPTATTEA